ncbi:hypothetical protein ABTM42_20510, partial [Acinetobacter baumannii]
IEAAIDIAARRARYGDASRKAGENKPDKQRQNDDHQPDSGDIKACHLEKRFIHVQDNNAKPLAAG